MFAFVVLDLAFFSITSEDWLRRTSGKWPTPIEWDAHPCLIAEADWYTACYL